MVGKKGEEERKRHEKEKEIKINNIKTEAEVWKYTNKYRKKREKIEERIELESWESHFMDLLGGIKRRVVLNQAEEEKEESERKEEEVEDITKEELIRQLKKLKKTKALGEDGIENEAWRYMSMEVGEVFWKLIKNIWRKEGVPVAWNKGIISPIYKKGEKKEVRNYREVMLMDIAYKTRAF